MLLLNVQRPLIPDPKKLPVPIVKLLTPADLQVTGISLVSCTKDNATKKLVITVSVTIKNNGQVRAAASGLKGFFHSPAGTATAKPIDGLASVGAMDPGSSLTANYIYRRPFSADAGFTLVPFDFWVKADGGNIISESNESNNGSAKIKIIPPR